MKMKLTCICVVFVLLVESLLAQRFGHGYPGGDNYYPGGGIYPGGGGHYPGGGGYYPGGGGYYPGGGYPGYGCRCRRYCSYGERYSGRCRRGGFRPFRRYYRRPGALCCPIAVPYGPYGRGGGGRHF